MSDSDARIFYCTNCLAEVESYTDETKVPGGTYRRWKCVTCNRVFYAVTITTDQLNIPLSPARPDDGPATQHRADNF